MEDTQDTTISMAERSFKSECSEQLGSLQVKRLLVSLFCILRTYKITESTNTLIVLPYISKSLS